MAASNKPTLKVNIVAADRPVWSGEATMVSLPASEGSMGILADHEPVLTATNDGLVKVTEPDGNVLGFKVTDGFISFDSNKLTVAVETCEEAQTVTEGE
ncbi:F0F1 ATP synthase subunit epsilon [Bifidobacterium sp. SMB2]|uniref:F0F1 ATP synthase subunit epsilon n=1 Tax=Bifidobacterium saimiriisciurei TaxID=2661627 RepID=A0ABX0C894_9BIFI|nr:MULTISPECIES: F0F1 ATP synthase subunit epsilon [Bifidobacterium]NEG95285.1 F0F1 ATP synthase subunit epsilon [Bifidobacterium sp. SMB2]NEH11362.1 F0F1 ATP synthase subunit epsilon [Bifidobacterium saimiriisciurei]